jgi:N-methylhydantoinase A/oxoprolinase/acetone carboxylase beta subunit
MALPVELVNLRCGLQGAAADIRLPPLGKQVDTTHTTTIAGYSGPVTVRDRAGLSAGQVFTGPAVITETLATTWLPAGWRCVVDGVGNLLLERDK